MFVIQHIWSRWTKASRGAHQSLPRPRLLGAYPVYAIDTDYDFLLHEISATEFTTAEKIVPAKLGAGPSVGRQVDEVLGLRLRKDHVEVTVTRPSGLHTEWPSSLPRPLFRLEPGQTACVDWNGRLRWTGRETYFRQHRYWLAMPEIITPSLFTEATPRKHLDLRTHIY